MSPRATAQPTLRRIPRRSTAARLTVDYTPGSYPTTPIGSGPVVHLLNRFAYGATPASVAAVAAAGGPAPWLDAQLAAPYDAAAAAVGDWWPDLRRSPADVWNRAQTGTRRAIDVMGDYVNRTLARRITSPRPVLEAVTDVLENHLHVPVTAEFSFPFRAGYGDLIRSKALGRFDDLLVASTVHPAMLMYLNANGSRKDHPNENLARELLELHTVGVGAFGEDDVKAVARLLTGFLVDPTGQLQYVTDAHDTQPVTVLGFSDANASADGRPALTRLLRYLASHPATARRIATRLAVRFVADQPPAALVDRLAAVYLASGTDLRPVVKTLVTSAEFSASAGQKVRDPHEELVALMRMLRGRVTAPLTPFDLSNLLWQGAKMMGHTPFSWPSPDGQPQVAGAWATASRATASLQMHARLATLGYPSGFYPTVWEFLPTRNVAFRDLVDHLHRLLHQRPSTSVALQACCQATGVDPSALITAAHPVIGPGWPLLLGAVLDLPVTFQR
ncbi:DUF1800 domain-containing protein [Nocardioides sp. TRM66260-LWL]|uniref:DUF1800 domain-containing protein n=1 Tax=Nocardioides sp. TRM66260-LWL TaxID=2874478 RepID=UPI001CC79DDF|nr:DUF1800 domain-containing protein [Nocardioides sp. TRM66260-LWL]MBZ5734459.1 DUF1800 domain-containing protein [Nocardioides sp. TRM66260-LWL]